MIFLISNITYQSHVSIKKSEDLTIIALEEELMSLINDDLPHGLPLHRIHDQQIELKMAHPLLSDLSFNYRLQSYSLYKKIYIGDLLQKGKIYPSQTPHVATPFPVNKKENFAA